MHSKLLFSIVSLFLFAGCATEYQPMSVSGGYSETYTGQNTATVYFNANGFSNMQDTRRFALRRAAEVTLERGYDYFFVENDNQGLDSVKLSGTVQCSTYGYSTTCNEYGGGTISKPKVQLDIRMFNGDTPNTTGYYDAYYLAGR